MPSDIAITFTECKDENAFYDPKTKQITMCYELMDYFEQLFSPYASGEELGTAMLYSTFFTFYHELGHALVDVYNLPITGREEDAVDQLATVILAEAESEDAALTAATWFLLAAQKTNIKQLPLWDEHSLDSQRFYNIICWVYGKNPQKHSSLVRTGPLPEARATSCENEYQKMFNSWNTLLSPYLKGPQTTTPPRKTTTPPTATQPPSITQPPATLPPKTTTPPQMVITVKIRNVIYDPPGQEPDNEMIELCNLGGSAVDIGDWKLTDGEGTYVVPASTIIPAGSCWSVFGYMYNPSRITSGLYLQNDHDEVILYDKNRNEIDERSW